MHRIDHVLVFCRAGAPELARLEAAGLRAGVRREHPGQGTQNACIGFGDAYLELIWLTDEAAARSPMVRPLGLQERSRWREDNASPFGVCVRPTELPGADAPFPTWDYAPPYLPAGFSIQMACNSGVLGEPLLFALRRGFTPLTERHALAGASLRRAKLTVKDLAPMSLLREARVPGLVFEDGTEHLLELELAGPGGNSLDLRPELPLVLSW